MIPLTSSARRLAHESALDPQRPFTTTLAFARVQAQHTPCRPTHTRAGERAPRQAASLTPTSERSLLGHRAVPRSSRGVHNTRINCGAGARMRARGRDHPSVTTAAAKRRRQLLVVRPLLFYLGR